MGTALRHDSRARIPLLVSIRIVNLTNYIKSMQAK